MKNVVLKKAFNYELFFKLSDSLELMDDNQVLAKADLIYRKAKDIVKSNLKAVYNSVSPYIRKVSKLWYDGANVIAQNWANQYGLTLEQASAIIATQSPQMPWFDNLHLAQVIMELMANRSDEVFNTRNVRFLCA